MKSILFQRPLRSRPFPKRVRERLADRAHRDKLEAELRSVEFVLRMMQGRPEDSQTCPAGDLPALVPASGFSTAVRPFQGSALRLCRR